MENVRIPAGKGTDPVGFVLVYVEVHVAVDVLFGLRIADGGRVDLGNGGVFCGSISAPSAGVAGVKRCRYRTGDGAAGAVDSCAGRPGAAALPRVFALFGAADERPRRDGEGAAADLQHAADGVVEGARLRSGRIDDGHAHAVDDVEHRLAVVALDLVPVQVEDEVGADVGHARGDDERVFDLVGDLDVGIAVFDRGDEFFDVVDFDLFGDDEVHVAAVNFRAGLCIFDVAALREQHAEHRAEHEQQRQKGDQAAFRFDPLHAPPPSSAAWAKTTVSEVAYPLLSALESSYSLPPHSPLCVLFRVFV